MRVYYIITVAFFLVPGFRAGAQSVSASVPTQLGSSNKIIFYLHGGVVTVRGNNAINESVPEWGPYEYLNILDSLCTQGFHVVSENRQQGVDDSVYIYKLARQIDTLLKRGIPAANIIVIGASAGWNIGIHVSARIKQKDVRFVIMGGCWPETYKEYNRLDLFGHFLSIIESSDPHGTCARVFEQQKQLTSLKEVTLHTGLSHGFFYKGYKHWIDPIMTWLDSLK